MFDFNVPDSINVRMRKSLFEITKNINHKRKYAVYLWHFNMIKLFGLRIDFK